MPRQDFRALREDIFRSFLRIRGKDIWWNQDFLADRVRLAEKGSDLEGTYLPSVLTNPRPLHFTLWASDSTKRVKLYNS